MIEFRPEFRFSSQIRTILLGFGLFSLDFGLNSLDLGPKGDEALRMELGGGTDVRTDGQIPPVFYRTLSPSGPLPKN